MKFKHCLVTRDDQRVDYYIRCSNELLDNEKHRSAYVYYGWFSDSVEAMKHLSHYLNNENCTSVHNKKDQILIKGQLINCNSWVVFTNDDVIEPDDFTDSKDKVTVGFTGSLAKFCPDKAVINKI
jgi:hypothetical protein